MLRTVSHARAGALDHEIARAVDEIGVVAEAALEPVGADGAIEDIVSPHFRSAYRSRLRPDGVLDRHVECDRGRRIGAAVDEAAFVEIDRDAATGLRGADRIDASRIPDRLDDVVVGKQIEIVAGPIVGRIWRRRSSWIARISNGIGVAW